jgi:hypothetical protein
MSIEIPQVDIKKVYEKVKNIDVYEIMLAEILDHANWLVREYTKECREDAEKRSRGDQEIFNALYVSCLYETKEQVKRELLEHINKVIDSARTLFFFYYGLKSPPGEDRFYKIVDQIVKETLRRFYPYDILIYEIPQSH